MQTKAMLAMLAAGAILMHAPAHAMQDGDGGGGAEYSVADDSDGGATTDGLLDVGWVRAFERWLDRINFGIGIGPRGGPAASRRGQAMGFSANDARTGSGSGCGACGESGNSEKD